MVEHNWLAFSKMGENAFPKLEESYWEVHNSWRLSISHGSQGEMDGQRKAYNWKSVMFTNVASSKDKKSRFSVSIEGSTISCSPGNCISRPHWVRWNLNQQLLTWSHEVEELKIWVKSNKFTCHQMVNEIMDQNLLRTLLEKIQANNPPWFSVIADEATDVCNSAQLNLSIWWVNNKYEVLEDTVGYSEYQIQKQKLYSWWSKTSLQDAILHFLCAVDKSTMVQPNFWVRIQQPFL